VPGRSNAILIAHERGRRALADLEAELKNGRLNGAVSQRLIARQVGISASEFSRIERGLLADVGIVRMSELHAAIGHRISIRSYPVGDVLRDAAHLALLAKLRNAIHPSLTWRTEVPVGSAGDLRAWDATISGQRGGLDFQHSTIAVETETHTRDIQALERRIGLKQRDSGVDAVMLVLSHTRYHRGLMRVHGSDLKGSFPFEGARALALLRAGVLPPASAVVLF
jgi:hypothetical protein